MAGGGGCVLGPRAPAAEGAPAAAQDAEDEETADTDGHADDDGEVVVDPGADFVADIAVAAALCGALDVIDKAWEWRR